MNDLMNNALGALIGGLIAVAVINGTQRHKGERVTTDDVDPLFVGWR